MLIAEEDSGYPISSGERERENSGLEREKGRREPKKGRTEEKEVIKFAQIRTEKGSTEEGKNRRKISQ